jgi:tetratricopeptide (TPR) repeat protein
MKWKEKLARIKSSKIDSFMSRLTKLTVLILVTLFSHSSFAEGSPEVGEKRILFDEFQFVQSENSISADYKSWLSQALPYNIAFRLEEKGYEILRTKDFDSEVGNKELWSETKAVEISGARHRVFGNFRITEFNAIEVKVTVAHYDSNGINLKGDLVIEEYLWDLEELSNAYSGLANKVHRNILKFNGFEKFNTGIFCFTEISAGKQELNSHVGQSIASGIYYEIQELNLDAIQLIDGDATLETCSKEHREFGIEAFEIKIIIDGTVKFLDDDGTVELRTNITLLDDGKHVFHLPVIVGSMSKYYLLEDKVVLQLNRVLSALIKENGELDKVFFRIVNSDDPKVLLKKAKEYYINDDIIRSEVLYERAIELDTGNSMAYALLGKLKLEKYNADQAFELSNKAIELDATNGEAYQTLIRIAFQNENLDLALDLLDKWEQNEPEGRIINNFKGNLYLFKKEYDQSIHYLNQQIEFSDTLIAESQLMLSVCYFNKMNSSTDSLEAQKFEITSQEFIKKSVKSGGVHVEKGSLRAYYMGRELANNDQYRTALKFFTLSNDIFPNKRSNLFSIDILVKIEQLKGIDELIEDGMKAGVLDSSIYLNTARQIRNYKSSDGSFSHRALHKALDYTKVHLKYDENSADAYQLRGSIYFRLKEFPKARDSYNKSYKLDSLSENSVWCLLDLAETNIILDAPLNSLNNLRNLIQEDLQKMEEAEETVKLLTNYLEIIAMSASGEAPEKLIEDLNSRLSKGYINGWNFDTMEHWIINQESNKHIRKRKDQLLLLTASMKERTL